MRVGFVAASHFGLCDTRFKGETMIQRYVSPNLIARLVESTFWRNIVGDPDLQPEIRDGKITVYYRGSAFLHELRLSKNQLVAGVSRAYVPLEDHGEGSELEVCMTSAGLISFKHKLKAMDLGIASKEARKAFKKRIVEVQGRRAEGAIVQAMCNPKRNIIVDQEISFADRRGTEGRAKTDKIDLCCYEPIKKKLLFVEVKRLEDPRLKAARDTRAEIIGQLEDYGRRLRQCQEQIPGVLAKVVKWKRALGMAEKYRALPEEESVAIFEKPALVVGNCDKTAVKRILSDTQPNFPKIAEIAEVASAIFLCGGDGCAIRMTRGAQQRVF